MYLPNTWTEIKSCAQPCLCVCGINKHTIVGQKSNDTSIHSWLPFNEKSTPGKNKDIQVYIRMSTKSDINLRMVTLMST